MPIRLTAAYLRRIQGAPARAARPRTPPALAAPSSAVRLSVTAPVRVVSEANLSGPAAHHMARHRRFKAQGEAVTAALVAELGITFVRLVTRGKPLRVLLTRLGGRGLDSDNLASAFKGCRDAVARFLGRDDGDPSVWWEYGQEPGGAHGVLVVIEARTGGGA